MKKTFFFVLIVLWFLNPGVTQTVEICHHVKILAADSMGGRKPGTSGIAMAADYIKQYFEANQLQLMFDKGYQDFEVTTGMAMGTKNTIKCDDIVLVAEKDYVPLIFSYDTVLNADIVFAGYGFTLKSDSLHKDAYDDYGKLDVKNKWVMVLRGAPEETGRENRGAFAKYSTDRNKMLNAKDHGAVGIILVNGTVMGANDALLPLPSEKGRSKSGFAALNITRAAADKILANSKKTIGGLEMALNKKMSCISFDIKRNVQATLNYVPMKVKTDNVVAVLMSPQKTDNYIVIGAHYDHLGMGGQGSGSRKPDTNAVHNGADDNASGSSTVLYLASRFAKANLPLNYNLIFVTFSGEEMGLLGSEWFVKHPPVDLKKIKLMVNFDMVGRLNDKHTLSVGGVGTFPDAEKILKADNDTNLLKLAFSKEGYGPSDHASFYGDSIPVLYFNTGVHEDYHTPADDYEKINCMGMHMISDYAFKVISDVAKGNYNLTYHEAGPKTQSDGRSEMKVKLGIMPDFANQDIKGVMAAGVNPDGAAFRGGMQKGDIITALDGKPVNDIYEYMERMKNFSAGQTITIDILRNNKKVVLLIQF